MKTNTVKILKSAGWYEGRKIDINKAEYSLKSRGYTITESFIKLYEEFGDIGADILVNNRERSIQLDIYIPVRYDYDSVIIEDYPKITKTKSLVPIGNVDGSSHLVIDENSRIYILDDGTVLFLGNNVEEALDNLCNVSWPKLREQGEYPVPDWW